jgi:hypothetical protein
MQNEAIIVIDIPDQPLCLVALASISHDRDPAPEFIELLGTYPDDLAQEISARVARERRLPVIGPHSPDF